MVILVFNGTIMPPWFYGMVSTDGAHDGIGNVVITAHMTGPVGKMNKVS